MTTRTALILASLAGFTAVAAGAFATHALETRMSRDMLDVFEIGARYHAYHALALLATTTLIPRLGRLGSAAICSFVGGICIFSGSLYLLALTGQRWLGAITPVGGLLLLTGWLLLGLSAIRLHPQTPD